MTECIVTSIAVTRKGQLCFFQVDIPRDVILIVDAQVTTGGMGAVALPAVGDRNTTGILKLQSENTANLCYASAVTFRNSPVEVLLPGYAGLGLPVTGVMVTPYYENDYREIPQAETIDGFTLYGYYEDQIGRQLNQDMSYTVGLYLWTKK